MKLNCPLKVAHFRPKQLAHLEPKWVAQLRPIYVNQINNHIGILHKICNSYFYKDPNKDDFFQEILIRLWKAYPNFTGQSKFSTWMYRVALNSAIDIFRKISIQPQFSELSRIEVEIPVSFNDNESDKKEQLYSIISQLDSNEKALILMYLDEYSYEEIAKTFNISTSNVGVKINRIKKKLSKISDNYGTE